VNEVAELAALHTGPQIAHDLHSCGRDHEDAREHERIGIDEAGLPVDIPAVTKGANPERIENGG
jgi:hypothetical protein